MLWTGLGMALYIQEEANDPHQNTQRFTQQDALKLEVKLRQFPRSPTAEYTADNAGTFGYQSFATRETCGVDLRHRR